MASSIREKIRESPRYKARRKSMEEEAERKKKAKAARARKQSKRKAADYRGVYGGSKGQLKKAMD